MHSDRQSTEPTDEMHVCGSPSALAPGDGQQELPAEKEIPMEVPTDTADAISSDAETAGEWHSPDTGRSETVHEEKRKLRTAAIAAAVLILCTVGAGLIWYMLPVNRAERFIKRARKHETALELTEAAADYRKALKMVPDSAEALDGLYQIWSNEVTRVMDLVDEQRFEEALGLARMLPQIDPDRQTMNHSALTVIYRQWITALACKGDTEGVNKLLSEASEDLSSEEITDIRHSADDTVRYLSLIAEMDSDAEKLMALSADGHTEEVFGRMPDISRKAEEAFDLGGTNPYRFIPEGSQLGLALYLYAGDVQIVVGEIDDDGVPNGEAVLYYAELLGEEGQYLYSYLCEWKSGRPNGYCVYREMGANAEDSSDDIEIKGNLVNGLWDGETEERYRDGETYFITYEQGKVIVLSEDGPDSNVVGYNREKNRMIMFTDYAVSTEIGVPFIYIY